MIDNLSWLNVNDFLLTPINIDLYNLKSKEILSEAKEISVFVSNYTIDLYTIVTTELLYFSIQITYVISYTLFVLAQINFLQTTKSANKI